VIKNPYQRSAPKCPRDGTNGIHDVFVDLNHVRHSLEKSETDEIDHQDEPPIFSIERFHQ
jgi:hypothetical protein